MQPLGDRLIVEILEEEEITTSGIVLPDTAKEKPQRGKVLAVGPGPRDEDGEYIKMDVEEGDEIIFSKYGGTEIKLGSDDVLILRESDVLAKVVGDRAAVQLIGRAGDSPAHGAFRTETARFKTRRTCSTAAACAGP